MVSTRHRGAEIRQFILEHVEDHPRDIVTHTAQTFGISRQGVHRHIQRLLHDKVLCMRGGTTRDREYTLCPRVEWNHMYILSTIAQEDVVWRKDIRPLLGDLPQNVLDIWQYGFTEILNNAIEHSAGHAVMIDVEQTVRMTTIRISDNGEGIFQKLQRELGLEDERHAVLELAKGKMTTDPAHHTGEGIFFTSRMFDHFRILSGHVFFTHQREEDPHDEAEDWITESQDPAPGTAVFLALSNTASRTPQEVFDQFTSEGEYSFTKTVVPVRLAQYGDEKLVSRSQAKRLLARIDRFKVVLLDFEGVEMIGQAFADEVFRVFAEAHPHIELFAISVNTAVAHMIRRAAGSRAATIFDPSAETARC
jgi:anti-sigma regulatory factor (Ser/Thr protein kinase)